MKSSVLAAILFCVFAFTAKGQLTQHDANLSLKYSYGTVDTTRYNNIGFQAEFFVNDYIGLNYNFDFIYRDDAVRQHHVPMGLIGGPFLIGVGIANMVDGDSTTKGGLAIVGLLVLALPDGISFHIPVNDFWDISPYANLVGIDFIKNRETNYKSVKYAMSTGVKFTYTANNLVTFSAFAETRKTGGIPWAFGGGAGIGILLGEK